MFYFLLIYVIGYIGYILYNCKRIGKIEESVEAEGIDSYFKVTIWWLMLEAILWFMWFFMFFLMDKIRPNATKEEYENQNRNL